MIDPILKVLIVVLLWSSQFNLLRPTEITEDNWWVLLQDVTSAFDEQIEQPSDADEEVEKMAPITQSQEAQDP
jgi:hypothetical protein